MSAYEILFLCSLLIVFFSYFGYPLSLALIAIVRRNEVRKSSIFPPLTLIITACNEETRIREKLENTVALDYPRDKLQILVASDGSTDRTNEIVLEYESRGITLLALGERRGKESAQKDSVGMAMGEVIVFSDVATRLEPDGLQKIVANFADPSVGCVSSEDRLLGQDGQPCGEGAYVRYEMWLRRLESTVNSLVGLSGSFFAARKAVCEDFSTDMPSDFRTVLNSRGLGLRGVSDPEAVGIYQDIAGGIEQEFQRKVRTVLRGLTVFFRHLGFLNLFSYGLFSYQLFCHKLLRWLVPLCLITALLANAVLALGGPFYLLIFAGHLAFYLLALLGLFPGVGVPKRIVRIPLYFVTVNASILVAWWRYLRGERLVMWTPTKR